MWKVSSFGARYYVSKHSTIHVSLKILKVPNRFADTLEARVNVKARAGVPLLLPSDWISGLEIWEEMSQW